MGIVLVAFLSGIVVAAGATTPADDAAFGGPALQQPGVVVAPPTNSQGAAPLPEIDAAAWLVADARTGEVLAANNAHLALPPASTLKLLTAVTLLPGLDPTLTYIATDADAGVDGSRVGLAPDETYTFDDLTHGLMLASGNDAAHAIAELSGGQDAAIAAMNERARQLGAVDTVALTPHGLDEPGQVTTAYDLALIARAALGSPDLAALVRTTTYDFPGLDDTSFQIQNQNRLLRDYDGAIGLKTGFTTEAGHTIAAAAERGDVQLIVTVLQPEQGRAEPVAAALLDWGFSVATSANPVGTLVSPEDVERIQVAAAVAEPAAAPGSDADGVPDQRHLGVDPTDLVVTTGAIAIMLVLIRRLRRPRQRRYAA